MRSLPALALLAVTPAVLPVQAFGQAASVADLKGRWQLKPVIVRKHCYVDRRAGFIRIGKAVGDETYSATAWIRFLRQPTGKPGCKAEYRDVHDIMELEISTYGERGTTNRYVVRFRKSLRHRAYPNQTWIYLGGQLRGIDPGDGANLTIVRRG